MENTEQEDLAEGTKNILLDITRQRESLMAERDDLQAKIDQLDKTDQHLRRIQVQLRNLLGGGWGGEDPDRPRGLLRCAQALLPRKEESEPP